MAKSKKIKAVDLTATVDALLEEYGDEIFNDLDEVIQETAEEAVSKLHSVQTFAPGRRPSGEYSRGWTSTEQIKKRTQVVRVIYNEELAGLAHLLEFGHANRGGGRTPGYGHIKPVDDWIQQGIVETFKKRAEQ